MVYLNETSIKQNLLPFTLTRHTASIPVGILTIQQKWELLLNEKVSLTKVENAIEIPANIIPTKNNFQEIIQLATAKKTIPTTNSILQFSYPWQIIQLNDYAINEDFILLTTNKKSQPISDSNKLINAEKIFLANALSIEHCILNASTGPIFIDEGATIQEGSMIRGPFYLGKNSVVKMGTKIYGATSVGNNCVAGGEIKNSTILDYSNKAHDGYLGDSLIGSWCNLGAGTSNSNLKNTAGNVNIQNTASNTIINAGLKAGLFMADYSRAAINTSFNTGTVVGVCCNIFGNQNPPKYMDHFTWGNQKYEIEKAIEHIKNWMHLKNVTITNEQIENLKTIYSQSKK